MISQQQTFISFIHKMAAKTSWYRYWTKLRHSPVATLCRFQCGVAEVYAPPSVVQFRLLRASSPWIRDCAAWMPRNLHMSGLRTGHECRLFRAECGRKLIRFDGGVIRSQAEPVIHVFTRFTLLHECDSPSYRAWGREEIDTTVVRRTGIVERRSMSSTFVDNAVSVTLKHAALIDLRPPRAALYAPSCP